MLKHKDLIEHIKDPLDLFKKWYDLACETEINDPNAMTLSTISNNQPSSRVVLLKSYDCNGFVFYTNSNSKKGKSIKEINKVALNFHWKSQNRQIRIEGLSNMINSKVADLYFNSRPRGSQIGAWSSKQSEDLSSRDELIKGRKSLLSEYASFLCSNGYSVLCIEMPCFGIRQKPNESSLSKSLNWYGKTLYGKMMSELISGINFLTKRKDVNKKKIFSLGFSMGATHSYWLAALDKRISKSIHICSFADLESLIKNGNHDLHNHYMTVPELLLQFSTSSIAGLIAPRPQLVCVGLKDKLTDKVSFNKSKIELIKIYKSFGFSENLQFIIEKNSGHRETVKMRRAVLNFLSSKN